MKRIYITGAIGSGKTFAARRLGDAWRIPHHSLDPVVFDLESPTYRQRFPDAIRDDKLRDLVAGDSWIIEGWYRSDWLIPIYRRAEVVLLLDTPLAVRYWRITTRFLRRKLGLIHDPVPMGGLKHLGRLLKWTRLFNAETMRTEIAQYTGLDCQIVIMRQNLTPSICERMMKAGSSC